MARVKRINNSRVPHQCGRGHEIPKGDSYLTAAPGYHSRPLYRCLSHPFKPSELTTSLASEPMSARESFEEQVADGFDTHEDLQAAWEELGSAIEDYQSQRQEALYAWENGNSTLEELVYTADAAYDEWSSFEVEEFDQEEPDESKQKKWNRWDEARQEHLAEQAAEAKSIASGLEF